MQTIELPKLPEVLQQSEKLDSFDVLTAEGLKGFTNWVLARATVARAASFAAADARVARFGRMLASPPPAYNHSRESFYVEVDKAMHQDKLNDGYSKRRQAQAERTARRYGGVL